MVEKSRIGRAELRVLEYVADHHPIPVAEVAKHFSQTAQLARTTILTVMEQLRRKGFLTRRKIGGIYHYAPKTSKSEILQAAIAYKLLCIGVSDTADLADSPQLAGRGFYVTLGTGRRAQTMPGPWATVSVPAPLATPRGLAMPPARMPATKAAPIRVAPNHQSRWL